MKISPPDATLNFPPREELKAMRFTSFEELEDSLASWGIPRELIKRSAGGVTYITGLPGLVENLANYGESPEVRFFQEPIFGTRVGLDLMDDLRGQPVHVLRDYVAERVRATAPLIIITEAPKYDYTLAWVTDEILSENPELAIGVLVEEGGSYFLELSARDVRMQDARTRTLLPFIQCALAEFGDHGGVASRLGQTILVCTETDRHGQDYITELFPEPTDFLEGNSYDDED